MYLADQRRGMTAKPELPDDGARAGDNLDQTNNIHGGSGGKLETVRLQKWGKLRVQVGFDYQQSYQETHDFN